MRIAVLNWSNRVVGGTEEYLRKFLPAAAAAGHELGFWCETDEPSDRPLIPAPSGGGSAGRLKPGSLMATLRAWRPDLIYAHGLRDPELEEAAYGVAPTVFFIHDYRGACISGTKMTSLPVATPCNLRFGPACLAHYYPRRCGGLNPFTMWRQFRLQSRRLAVLRGCAAVVTHSEHMREECIRNGIAADHVYSFPYYIVDATPDGLPPRPLPAQPTLLFLGRMESVKGGRILLEALPQIRAQIDHPLRVVFAGDGRERATWEARAAIIQAADPGLQIDFPGWTNAAGRDTLLRGSDLLVVPSIWPEPFGRVGPEAGVYGLPVAAFAVGGTRSWLTDGENGFLAPGRLPTAAGLAEAVTRCLADPAVYQRLRAGAVRLAARFTWSNHFAALSSIFSSVVRIHSDRTGLPTNGG